MTYIPFSHSIDFDVILQDPTIVIPSEEFSMLNALASAVAALGLRERDKLRSRVTEFWPKNLDAVGAVWELLFMDGSIPSAILAITMTIWATWVVLKMIVSLRNLHYDL